MSTRDHIQLKHNGCTYYFTTTVFNWKHVFIKRSVISILINSILFFQNKRQVLTNGYCIMPNHLHWIFTLSESNDDIITIIRTFKSYTATQILKCLKKRTDFDKETIDLQPHWALVDQPEEYPFSSFRYYLTGRDWNGISILPLLR